MWWTKKEHEATPQQTSPTDYPTGLAVETDEGVYYIQKQYRYLLPTDRIIDSWNFNSIAYATEYALAGFKKAGKLGFRDGTLIKNIADGKVYLISATKRRHIVSPDAFEKYGLNKELVVVVSEAEANLHNDGEVLT